MKENWKKLNKWQKAGLILAVVVLIGILLPKAPASDTVNNSAKDTVKNENNNTSISQREAEETCQNAEMLQSYVSIKDTTILKLGSNTMYDDNTGYFTVDKTPVSILNWQGTNKDTDENISFMCSVGRIGERIVLHQLVIGSETVYSQELYNKDGEVIE